MGTSGSYGGSGKSSWQAARRHFEELVERGGHGGARAGAVSGVDPADDSPSGDAAEGGGVPAGAPAEGTDGGIGAAAAAIAAALARDDPELRPRNAHIYALTGLLPHLSGRGAGGGGGAAAGGGGARGAGTSRGTGRTGDGSRRSVSRGIQRGSSAIAAGYALREGDRAALETLHLDLDTLQVLGPRQQCDRILAAVLGDGDHPDEYALKKAAAEQLKAILSSGTLPSALETIQDFVSGYIYQLGLLEIRAQMKAGLDTARVIGIEKDLKMWIRSRVRAARAGLAAAAAIPVAQMRDVAARIGNEAIRIIRAAAPVR